MLQDQDSSAAYAYQWLAVKFKQKLQQRESNTSQLENIILALWLSCLYLLGSLSIGASYEAALAGIY